MKSLMQTSNFNPKKSTKDITELMQRVLLIAKDVGATSACVSANHDVGFGVDVRMGETETVQFSEDAGVSVTVYIGNQKGSSNSTDTTDTALQTMVQHAYEIAKVSAMDKAFGLPEKELMATNIPDLDLMHPWDINPEKAIDLALECETKALSLDKRIENSDGVHVASASMAHGFANSHGFHGVIHGTRHTISCSLIAKENGAMQRDYEYTTSRNPENLLTIDKLADNVVLNTVNRLGAKKIKTQKLPVIFSNRVSAGLIGNFIGAISGGNLYRKNSFLLNSLGTKIFPDNICIHEQPYLLQALGSSPYDAEGIATRNNLIIENGILNQYILSTYSARKLGLETTANSGGVFNLTVDATMNSLDEILKTMQTGILVTELMGQGVNILTGDFSRGASGFWVENGEIKFPVEEITIAGNLKDMFLNIGAIGSDINNNSALRCGSILIESMIVAGS